MTTEQNPLFVGSREASLAHSPHVNPLVNDAFVVEYHCNNHIHWAAAPRDEGYEGVALQLVEDMEQCHEKWGYRGEQYQHTNDQIKDAYSNAITQVLTRDLHAEFAELQWKRRMYNKWGGHMPNIFLQPSRHDPREWEAILPDSNGDPHIYDANPLLAKGLPEPSESGARKRRMDTPLGGYLLPKETRHG
jgi:hypothetical protein